MTVIGGGYSGDAWGCPTLDQAKAQGPNIIFGD